MNDKTITILDDETAPPEEASNLDAQSEEVPEEAEPGVIANEPGAEGQGANEATELDQLRAANSDLQEQVKRIAAEFQNFRRRQEEEQKRVKVRLREEIIRSLLPILDHLERTMSAARQGQDNAFEGLMQGLELIDKDVKNIFSDHGLSAIEAQGQTFDPALHEAIMMEETEEYEDQTIILELQRGYRLNDRVLRPSLVKVARNS